MNEYLNQIEISGITYDLVASGGTGGSGVTSGQVETMIRNYTYDKFTIDRKIDNAFDPEQYYTRTDIDIKELDLNERIDELSGKTITVSGKVSTLEEDVENAFQEIKNVKLELSGAIDTKQDLLVAGDNIIITGNVISAVMSGGSGVTSGQVQMMIDQSISGISGNTNVISGDVKTLSGDVKTISGDVIVLSGDLETKIDALSGNLDDKQDKLIAGQGISISDSNVISTSGSVTQIEAAWGDAFGHDLYIAQYGGQNPGPKIIAKSGEGIIINRIDGEPTSYNGVIRCNFNTVQRKLSAGTGIDITDNVISVTGGGQSSGVTSGEVQTMIDQSISGKVEEVKSSYRRLPNGGSGYSVDAKYSEVKTNIYPIFEIGEGLKNTPDATYSSINKLSVDMDYINSHISGGTSGITSGEVQTMINQSISGKANTSDVVTDNDFGYLEEQVSAYGRELDEFYWTYEKNGVASALSMSIGNGLVIDNNEGATHILNVDSTSAVTSGSTAMLTSGGAYAALQEKPNIWCGTEAQWSQISGSTQSGTLYLIY